MRLLYENDEKVMMLDLAHGMNSNLLNPIGRYSFDLCPCRLL